MGQGQGVRGRGGRLRAPWGPLAGVETPVVRAGVQEGSCMGCSLRVRTVTPVFRKDFR